MPDKPRYPRKIVSGGQTGVDRAALDVALELGVLCGGWCPKGRKAEDGVIDPRYPLQETESLEYSVRTEMNVQNSDATLILNQGLLTGGTALTLELAKINKKPHWVVDLSEMEDPALIKKWMQHGKVKVLNVAGPPESNRPGIYDRAIEFLRRIFKEGQNGLIRK